MLDRPKRTARSSSTSPSAPRAGWRPTRTCRKASSSYDHLVVRRWDFELVRRAIADLCRRVEGSDWETVGTKLSRYGAWEFEDYEE